MLIHIFDDTPHHYNPMQYFFAEQCSVNKTQQFWARVPSKKNDKNSNKVTSIIFYQNNDDLLQRLSALPKNAQVVFHGLFEVYLWRKLLFMSVVNRCSCVFWGAELYRHGKKNRTVKQYLAQLIHQFFIFRCNSVIALNPGDALLVRTLLKRKNAKVLPYPLIGLKKSTTSEYKNETGLLKILVGNSAAASNEHHFALNQLAHLADENVQIIVPLNYAGTPDYINDVISYGKKLFADKFVAITQMLDKSAYDELLNSVDITVFTHQRQQGLYVAYAMLLLGKPMFLSSSTSSYSNLTALGFSVYASEKINEYSYQRLSELALCHDDTNQALMEQHFSENALVPKWSGFLNGLFVS